MKLVSPAGTEIECRDEQVPAMLAWGYRVDKGDKPVRQKRANPRRPSGESK